MAGAPVRYSRIHTRHSTGGGGRAYFLAALASTLAAGALAAGLAPFFSVAFFFFAVSRASPMIRSSRVELNGLEMRSKWAAIEEFDNDLYQHAAENQRHQEHLREIPREISVKCAP